MRSLTLLILLLFIGCNSQPEISKNPSWYHNLPKESFETIGYGFGKDEIEAKEMARVDIAQQLSVSVKSEVLRSESTSNGREIKATSSQKSSIKLSDLEVVKISSDRKFVALKFINLPFEKKFLQKIGEWRCGVDNSYWRSTDVGREALKRKDCLPELRVFQNGDSFYLNSDKVSEPIPNLNKLFFSQKSEIVELKAPFEVKENSNFDIEFKSTENGFITIFNIGENGEVYEVISNYRVTENRSYSTSEILNMRLYGKIENGRDSEKSMFIAIFSENSLETSFSKVRNFNERKYKPIEFNKFLKL